MHTLSLQDSGEKLQPNYMYLSILYFFIEFAICLHNPKRIYLKACLVKELVLHHFHEQ